MGPDLFALMAELVYALASGASSQKGLGVRISLKAHKKFFKYSLLPKLI